MPMAVLEAQAMGIPVVASRVTGVVDAVEDGRTGLLGTTEGQLRDALATLARDADRRRALGDAAVERMHTHFSMSDLAQRSFDAYSTLGIRIPEMKGVS